jgi:stage II sporulation protein R
LDKKENFEFFPPETGKKSIELFPVEKSILAGLFFSILISIVNFAGNCDNMADKVVRLHIVANSDSAEDQEIKLKVRDDVVRCLEEEKKGLKNSEEAFRLFEKKIESIKKTAKETLLKEGSDQDVHVSLEERASFGTRIYDNAILPAGNYKALKVVIGEGKGKNWWCVVFQPMCLPAAQETCDFDDIFSPGETNIVENKDKYVVKFKIVEIFESIRVYAFEFFARISKIFVKDKRAVNERSDSEHKIIGKNRSDPEEDYRDHSDDGLVEILDEDAETDINENSKTDKSSIGNLGSH